MSKSVDSKFLDKVDIELNKIIRKVREEQYPARATIERQCVICCEYVYWPEIKTLPPACGSHRYSELIEEIEPLRQQEKEKP